MSSVYYNMEPPSDNDEPRQLFYQAEDNYIIDERGCTVFDIFRIISPNQLYLFKLNKGYMFVVGRNGEMVELIYEDYRDEC